MYKRWYLRPKVKSKGYWNGGFNYDHCSYGSNSKHVTASYTKQKALAVSYETERELRDRLAKELKHCRHNINTQTALYNDITSLKWAEMSDQERIDFLSEKRISVNYTVEVDTFGGSRIRNKYMYFRKGAKPEDYNPEQLERLRNADFSSHLLKAQDTIARKRKKIEILRSMSIVSEDYEIKFMDKEKSTFKWEERKSTDTSHSYCSHCGGAVPNIPQLVVYRRGVVICAICMMKLAEEAKRMAGKVPDEIMELYERDVFMRNL